MLPAGQVHRLPAALADRLGLPLIEGDALHPPANVAAMRARRPLTDVDRRSWLDAVGAALAVARKRSDQEARSTPAPDG